MIKKSNLYIVIILFFLGCEPEEMPINIEGLGEINYTQIDLGEDYCYQKYYHLDDDLVVAENLITDWDLRFSNSSNAIMLNSSKYMRVISFNPLTFFSLDDLINNIDYWNYDAPSGDITLLAFNNGGSTLEKGHFLVDKGYNCEDEHIGYSIFQIIDYTDNHYVVQVIEISDDGSWVYNSILEIEKTGENDYTYFSFENNIIDFVNFNWDLCFSQYTEFNVFPPGGNMNAEPLPTYRVVGVLQNSHVSVVIDTVNDFENITMQDVINNYDFEFNFNLNSIGYNWKYYDLQSGLYSIDSPVYIIKTSDSNYYKLLFLDFYNDEGNKGAPMFQVEKI